MGGGLLNSFEKQKLSEIDNFFILEYVKRKLLLDEKQREAITTWREIFKIITEILTHDSFIYHANDDILCCIIDHFKNNQLITESSFIKLFGDLPQNYLKTEITSKAISKLNNSINNFILPKIGIHEAEEYYDILTLIHDNDIGSIIINWDAFLIFKDDPIINDYDGKKIRIGGASIGEYTGVYILNAGKKHKIDRIICVDCPELTAPNPRNIKINPESKQVLFFNSYNNKIEKEDKLLKNKTIFVINSGCMYESIGILQKNINKLYPKNIYIHRYKYIFSRLIGLYIWDKVNIEGLSVKNSVSNINDNDELSLSKKYSTYSNHLPATYYKTKKCIENVFNILRGSI